MKRFLIGTIVLASVTACQDSTTAPFTPATSAPVALAESEASNPIAAAVPHMYAVVALDGTLTSGRGVASVLHAGTGQYEVTFTSNVQSCGYQATTINAYSQALDVFTASGHFGSQGVFVETKNQGGGLTDGPFNLVVTCGNDGIPFAVVDYAAQLVRGSPGVSLAYLGAGRYNVTFATSVSSCSFIATVADPGAGLVLGPSYVYTGSGPNANTIYIETKNPGGGLQDGVPFHLAAICLNVVKLRYAVVRGGGTIQRANPGTTSTRPATGQFVVTTSQNLTGCARIATRGSTNTGVPFTPARMEIVPAASANASGVWMRGLPVLNPAFINQAFHLGVVC